MTTSIYQQFITGKFNSFSVNEPIFLPLMSRTNKSIKFGQSIAEMGTQGLFYPPLSYTHIYCPSFSPRHLFLAQLPIGKFTLMKWQSLPTLLLLTIFPMILLFQGFVNNLYYGLIQSQIMRNLQGLLSPSFTLNPALIRFIFNYNYNYCSDIGQCHYVIYYSIIKVFSNWIQEMEPQQKSRNREQINQSNQKFHQKSQRQLLRHIGCTELYRYLTPISQRIRLGYIQSCFLAYPHIQLTSFKQSTIGLDCEMIMTNIGPQVVKAVIINIDQQILYDQWFGLKANTSYNDLLTHITGINQETFQAKIKKLQAYSQINKQDIMRIIQNKVIVGHDLANDIKLLDITHQLYIDTVSLLPHHFGLPFKNKLKDITYEYLKRHIQWGFHDPFQDSLAALQIVQKHVADGRGTIQIETFPIFNYQILNGSNNWQLVLEHAQLQISKLVLFILRGSRALSTQIQHQYKSDWDFVAVYDTMSKIDGRLIKLPNVDISFFDISSFQNHLQNNDISYLQIFFLPQKCIFINKIQFPFLNIDTIKLRSSLGFHLNKSKLKIKRFQKQLSTKPYYRWKILKAHHMAIRFMDLFLQLNQIYQTKNIKIQIQPLQNLRELQQNRQKCGQNSQKDQLSFEIEQTKKKLLKVNILNMNKVWYQIQDQFLKNKNFQAVVSKLQKIQQQKMDLINSVSLKIKSIRYRDNIINKDEKYNMKLNNKCQKFVKGNINKAEFKIEEQGVDIQKINEVKSLAKLQTVQFLKKHSYQDLQSMYKILIKRHRKYENLIQLHYMQSSNFQLRIPKQCRGMILDQLNNYQIVALPYYKFFDFNDEKFSQLPNLDWQSAKLYQKKDGSMAFLYFYDNKWNVASSTVPDGSNNYCFARTQTVKQFGTEFWSIFFSLGFKLPNFQDRFKTFIFQIMSKDHIIVVKRTSSQLCLHGVRDILSQQEQNHLPYGLKYNWKVAEPIPISKQQMNIDSLVHKAQSLCPLKSEGFVLCDKNWIRVKIKNSSYVRINWLGQLNLGYNKDPKKYILIQIILTGEASTFIKYCPQWEKIIKQFQQKIQKLNKEVVQAYEKWKHLPQKQFAKQIDCLPNDLKKFVFAIRSNPELYYGKAQRVINPKKFYLFISSYK